MSRRANSGMSEMANAFVSSTQLPPSPLFPKVTHLSFAPRGRCRASTPQGLPMHRQRRAIQMDGSPSASESTNLESTPPVGEWSCMEGCGACCFLGDFDYEVIQDLLKSPDDVEKYLSMLAPDGWCKFYNKESRRCTVYEARPRFCRVDIDVFSSLYGVTTSAEFNSFAIECCNEHIAGVYPALGDERLSNEQQRFNKLVAATQEFPN